MNLWVLALLLIAGESLQTVCHKKESDRKARLFFVETCLSGFFYSTTSQLLQLVGCILTRL